jgi:hypothetical protein
MQSSQTPNLETKSQTPDEQKDAYKVRINNTLHFQLENAQVLYATLKANHFKDVDKFFETPIENNEVATHAALHDLTLINLAVTHNEGKPIPTHKLKEWDIIFSRLKLKKILSDHEEKDYKKKLYQLYDSQEFKITPSIIKILNLLVRALITKVYYSQYNPKIDPENFFLNCMLIKSLPIKWREDNFDMSWLNKQIADTGVCLAYKAYVGCDPKLGNPREYDYLSKVIATCDVFSELYDIVSRLLTAGLWDESFYFFRNWYSTIEESKLTFNYPIPPVVKKYIEAFENFFSAENMLNHTWLTTGQQNFRLIRQYFDAICRLNARVAIFITHKELILTTACCIYLKELFQSCRDQELTLPDNFIKTLKDHFIDLPINEYLAQAKINLNHNPVAIAASCKEPKKKPQKKSTPFTTNTPKIDPLITQQIKLEKLREKEALKTALKQQKQIEQEQLLLAEQALQKEQAAQAVKLQQEQLAQQKSINNKNAAKKLAKATKKLQRRLSNQSTPALDPVIDTPVEIPRELAAPLPAQAIIPTEDLAINLEVIDQIQLPRQVAKVLVAFENSHFPAAKRSFLQGGFLTNQLLNKYSLGITPNNSQHQLITGEFLTENIRQVCASVAAKLIMTDEDCLQIICADQTVINLILSPALANLELSLTAGLTQHMTDCAVALIQYCCCNHRGDVFSAWPQIRAEFAKPILTTPKSTDNLIKQNPLAALELIQLANQTGKALSPDTIDAIKANKHSLLLIKPSILNTKLNSILFADTNTQNNFNFLLKLELFNILAPEFVNALSAPNIKEWLQHELHYIHLKNPHEDKTNLPNINYFTALATVCVQIAAHQTLAEVAISQSPLFKSQHTDDDKTQSLITFALMRFQNFILNKNWQSLQAATSTLGLFADKPQAEMPLQPLLNTPGISNGRN